MTRALAFIAACCAVSCSGPSGDETQVIPTGASREAFPAVADVLHSRCGSLDCHGTVGRNLRIYGLNGLRIDGITGTGLTTAQEYDANFLSVVALEPITFGLVVRDGGRDPDRLSLVRKARGVEAHKGGKPMPQDSTGDRCLISWLSSSVNADACADAAEMAAPDWP
jgi:hypothetical protein